MSGHPTFEDSIDAGAAFTNFHGVQMNGALNASLTENQAARLSFQTIRHDGYLSDGEDDEDSQAARLQYRIDPADRMSVVLASDYFHQGGRGGGNALLDAGFTTNDRVGLADPRAQAYYLSLGRVPVTAQDLSINGNYGGGKATLTWNSDLCDLVVIPAYRAADFDSVAVSGPSLRDAEHDHQQSFESRFAFAEMAGLRLIFGFTSRTTCGDVLKWTTWRRTGHCLRLETSRTSGRSHGLKRASRTQLSR